jgi:hypothetical protein
MKVEESLEDRFANSTKILTNATRDLNNFTLYFYMISAASKC